MAKSSEITTAKSLLLRVRDPADEEAWKEFVAIYAPQVFAWARKRGFQNADAADLTQTVLGKLVTAMQTFEYDPRRGRFRAWLQTVTKNAVRSFASSLRRPDVGHGGTSIGVMARIPEDDDLDDLRSLLSHQAELELVAAAEQRVRLRVKPENWQAWELTVRQGISPAEAARQLKMNPSAVYVARTRVTKLMQTEVARIDQLGRQGTETPDADEQGEPA